MLQLLFHSREKGVLRFAFRAMKVARAYPHIQARACPFAILRRRAVNGIRFLRRDRRNWFDHVREP
jgi:hypothetical protein